MKKHLLIIGSPEPRSSDFLHEFIANFRNDDRFNVRILEEQQTTSGFDLSKEQDAIDAALSVTLHFPIYWYSMPALLKAWLDSILTYGWAFDAQGGCLDGKTLVTSVTTGAPLSSYQPGGTNLRTLDTYLLHLERTAAYVGFNYLGAVATDQVRGDRLNVSAWDQKVAICGKLGISATA